jgi:hypothetical protein
MGKGQPTKVRHGNGRALAAVVCKARAFRTVIECISISVGDLSCIISAVSITRSLADYINIAIASRLGNLKSFGTPEMNYSLLGSFSNRDGPIVDEFIETPSADVFEQLHRSDSSIIGFIVAVARIRSPIVPWIETLVVGQMKDRVQL